MKLRRRFGFVAIVLLFVDLSMADPETVDGLLKKRSEPVLGRQDTAGALPETLLGSNNKFPPGTRLHYTSGFRQDTLGRNFHHGYPSQKGKMLLKFGACVI